MTASRVRRSLALLYGVFAYALGLGTIAYAVGFVGNVLVPKSVDYGVAYDSGTPLLLNAGLILLFGLQHSLMARPWFKERWTRLVPKPIKRSTYVLAASLALLVLMWGWQPLPGTVWHVDQPLLVALLWTLFVGGWLLMFAAVLMIDMNDLLGLRQVLAYARGNGLEPIDFQTPAAYRYVRHPLLTGFLVAFWATPHMTVGHLLFATGMSLYIVVGAVLEERDMVTAFGDRYRRYQSTVPMFVPRPGRRMSHTPGDTEAE